MVKDWAFSFLQTYTPSVNLFLPLFLNNLWWLILGNATHTKESKWNTTPLWWLDCLIDRMAAVVKTLKLPVVSLRFPKSHPGRNFHFHQLVHYAWRQYWTGGGNFLKFLVAKSFHHIGQLSPTQLWHNCALYNTQQSTIDDTIDSPNHWQWPTTWAVASMLLTLVARCWVRNSCKLSHRVAR